MTILVLAYYFPPDPQIGGARPFRFKKYLERMGHRVVVLTAAEGNERDVIHVTDPLREKPREGLAFQAERFAWKLLLRADIRVAWSQAVFEAGKAFLAAYRGGDPVTILSTAPPVSTHLAAWRLARHSGCRWVADFRDPVYTKGGEVAALAWIAPALQHSMLKAADTVIANTDAMEAMWQEQFPELSEKIHTLWNGYDPEDAIPVQPVADRTQRVVSHVGELYGGRDMAPVVRAFGRMLEKGSLAAGSVRVCQIGPTEDAELPPREYLDRAIAVGWLEVRPPVKPAEARALALESDGLLLIQPHTGVQVPGKLFEYLRMARPIFAYVVRNSPIVRILEKAGIPFECVYPGDSDETMDAAVLRFAAMLGDPPQAPSVWFEETFEARRQAETLITLISRDHTPRR